MHKDVHCNANDNGEKLEITLMINDRELVK